MARLRGFERYNNPAVGADLVIKKLNPGVDEGVGYLVSVFQDGEFKDRLKITSKKKLKELIDSFKDFYRTDKAFLNGMLFHITYKDDKEQKMPRKHTSPEEKHNEKEEKEAMVKNIDETLYKKAALIERHLNRLFDPELPAVIRTAEESQEQPTSGLTKDSKEEIEEFLANHGDLDKNSEIYRLLESILGLHANEGGKSQEQPSGGDITEEFITKSKDEIEKFVASNKELAEGTESYQLYNALQRWVADVNAKIDNGEYQGLDANKAKSELADYFSNYEFLKEKRSASSTVIITDDNIEQLIDSLDSAIEGTITDNKVESVVDTLNDLSCASSEEINNAKCIADEASKSIVKPDAGIIIATCHAVDMLVKRFKDDTKAAKYSGTLQSVVASWAVQNDVDIKMAELVYKFCEAEFSPYHNYIKYAAMANVGVADSDETTKAINEFIKTINDLTLDYPKRDKDFSAILAPFLKIVAQSINDDAYTGMAFKNVVQPTFNVGNVFSTLIMNLGEDKIAEFSNIQAALTRLNDPQPIQEAIINFFNQVVIEGIDAAAGGSFKKWVADTTLQYGLKYGNTKYQQDYDEMIKDL